MNFTITHRTVVSLTPPTYGIWLPGKGWLHSNGENGILLYYMEPRKEVAKSVAKLCSKGAQVRFIDQSLIDMQKYFLEIDAEKKGVRKGKK